MGEKILTRQDVAWLKAIGIVPDLGASGTVQSDIRVEDEIHPDKGSPKQRWVDRSVYDRQGRMLQAAWQEEERLAIAVKRLRIYLALSLAATAASLTVAVLSLRGQI